jgi:hypothetical protein
MGLQSLGKPGWVGVEAAVVAVAVAVAVSPKVGAVKPAV